jgi:hypothetical protein
VLPQDKLYEVEERNVRCDADSIEQRDAFILLFGRGEANHHKNMGFFVQKAITLAIGSTYCAGIAA